MPNADCTIKMTNLPKEGTIFKSEADAYFQIFRDDKIVYTSEVVENKKDPKFKKALFKVGLMDKVPGVKYLVKVLDKNSGTDDLIGQVEVRYPFGGEYPLNLASSGAGNARIEFI